MNFDVNKMSTKWRNQIADAKKNFKKERLMQEYTAVVNEVDVYKAHVQQQSEARLKQLEDELKSIPKRKDPKRGPLDAEKVSVLNYYSKMIKSRLAVEGNTQAGFLNVLQEIVDLEGHFNDVAYYSTEETKAIEHNIDLKWALLDNIHEIFAAGRELISRESDVKKLLDEKQKSTELEQKISQEDKDWQDALTTGVKKDNTFDAYKDRYFHNLETFESKIREQFQLAKNSLKDPKQIALEIEYDEKRSKAVSEKHTTRIMLNASNEALESTKLQYVGERDYFIGAEGERQNVQPLMNFEG